MRVLLIEDEQKLSKYIKKALEEESMEVDTAFDGYVGKRLALVNNYDVIILDIIIPKINGFDLSKELRDKGVKTPIILLTALGTIEDKLKGFRNGADDYLVKPFEIKELIARIFVLQKRVDQLSHSGGQLTIDDLILDLEKKNVTRNGKEVSLTAKEFALLEYFLRNKDKVISRLEIADNVWGNNFDTGTNVIDVYVNFLRKKIDSVGAKKLIHTAIGMGYIMKEEEEK